MPSTRKPYPSDVSDDGWSLAAPYLTLMREDADQREHPLRELFNGLRYVIRPVRAGALRLISEKRASKPAMSPAPTPCLDIFSPPPGESEVTSQFDRLSSNETKMAPKCVRIAAGSACGSSDINRLQSEWFCNLSLATRPAAIHPPWNLRSARNDGYYSATATPRDGPPEWRRLCADFA